MEFKIKIFLLFLVLAISIIAAGAIFGVIDLKEFQKSEPVLEKAFVIDLTDYLMIGYFYDGGSVLIMSPIIGYYDRDINAEIILTEEKTYCMKNWDYKILYSKPDSQKNKGLDGKFFEFEF